MAVKLNIQSMLLNALQNLCNEDEKKYELCDRRVWPKKK